MTLIERKVYVCDIHGETRNVVGMGADRPPWCVECCAPVEVIRLVPDNHHRAVLQRDALLRKAGYFPWGDDAWIHCDDEGTVMSTADAVDHAGGSRS